MKAKHVIPYPLLRIKITVIIIIFKGQNSMKCEIFLILRMMIEYIKTDNFAENRNKNFPSILKLLLLVYNIYTFLSKSNLPWFLMDSDPQCIILWCP